MIIDITASQLSEILVRQIQGYIEEEITKQVRQNAVKIICEAAKELAKSVKAEFISRISYADDRVDIALIINHKVQDDPTS